MYQKELINMSPFCKSTSFWTGCYLFITFIFNTFFLSQKKNSKTIKKNENNYTSNFSFIFYFAEGKLITYSEYDDIQGS